MLMAVAIADSSLYYTHSHAPLASNLSYYILHGTSWKYECFISLFGQVAIADCVWSVENYEIIAVGGSWWGFISHLIYTGACLIANWCWNYTQCPIPSFEYWSNTAIYMALCAWSSQALLCGPSVRKSEFGIVLCSSVSPWGCFIYSVAMVMDTNKRLALWVSIVPARSSLCAQVWVCVCVCVVGVFLSVRLCYWIVESNAIRVSPNGAYI